MAKFWNSLNSSERYELLRRWYPDSWTINSLSLKKWEQIPGTFRRTISALYQCDGARVA